MKKLLLIVLAVAVMGCSGGGGGGTTSPTDPSASNLAIAPNTASAGSTVVIGFSFNYSSTNGLSTLTYTYEGTSTTLDASACTSAFTQCLGLLVNATLSSTVGPITITTFVTDTAGNKSNTSSVTLTQT
ncbi:MAG: hypothetical protein ACUZ8E_11785 [Candidatus Anammoxibacter sp.]